MDRDELGERLLDLEQGTKRAAGSLRFSIRGLMAALLLAGIVLGTVKDFPNPFTLALVTLIALVVLGLLCTSVLGVLLGEGRQRAFWMGFAVFGWAFFILGLVFLLRNFALHVLGAILPIAYPGGLIARGFAAEDDPPIG